MKKPTLLFTVGNKRYVGLENCKGVIPDGETHPKDDLKILG